MTILKPVYRATAEEKTKIYEHIKWLNDFELEDRVYEHTGIKNVYWLDVNRRIGYVVVNVWTAHGEDDQVFDSGVERGSMVRCVRCKTLTDFWDGQDDQECSYCGARHSSRWSD